MGASTQIVEVVEVEVVEQAPVVQESSVHLLSMDLSLVEDFSVEQFPLKISDTHSKNLTQADIDYLDSKNWHIASGRGDKYDVGDDCE